MKFGEMEFGEMKRNTSNWSNFCMLLRRAGLTASAGLSCFHKLQGVTSSYLSVLYQPMIVRRPTMTDPHTKFKCELALTGQLTALIVSGVCIAEIYDCIASKRLRNFLTYVFIKQRPLVMLRFPNFDFRSISTRFLAQNDDFDSIQF